MSDKEKKPREKKNKPSRDTGPWRSNEEILGDDIGEIIADFEEIGKDFWNDLKEAFGPDKPKEPPKKPKGH
jgi:hypothetical protein